MNSLPGLADTRRYTSLSTDNEGDEYRSQSQRTWVHWVGSWRHFTADNAFRPRALNPLFHTAFQRYCSTNLERHERTPWFEDWDL